MQRNGFGRREEATGWGAAERCQEARGTTRREAKKRGQYPNRRKKKRRRREDLEAGEVVTADDCIVQ